MIKNAILTLLLPLSMVTLAHANDAVVACNQTSLSSSVILKKERSDDIAPTMLNANQTECDNTDRESSKPELTDSHDALLNPRLPGTLLATR
ncbi:hypothetical protein [Alteromonas sp. H39]|uniref:hypothetical protein n=1 Tax=Alteromonas sp. H39 TaxID=3389876 RepID=UPI0039DF8B35